MKKDICRLIILTLSFILCIIPCVSFATSTADIARQEGKSESSYGSAVLNDKARTIVNALIWCGYAVALGMVVYIGIKYILGAADAKANMKSAIVNYLIGAAFVFAATTIANIVVNVIPKGDADAGDLATQIINAAESTAQSIAGTYND